MSAPMPPRCALARFVPEQTDFERLKKEGWIKDGILVIDITNPLLGPIERQVLTHIGKRFYGERNG